MSDTDSKRQLSYKEESPGFIKGEIINKPLLVLRDAVIFPRILTPVTVQREIAIRAVETANRIDGELIVVTQRHPDIETPTLHDIYKTGVRVTIARHLQLPTGGTNILLQGLERVDLLEWGQTETCLMAKGQEILEFTEPEELSLSVRAQMRTALSLFERCANLHSHIPEDALVAAANITSPGWLADFITSVIDVSTQQQQEVLDIPNPLSRLKHLSILLAMELDVLELEDRIQNQVQQAVDRNQREYFLREQIKIMQNELGEFDSTLGEIYELQQQLEALSLPEEVKLKANKELKRLADMPPMAPETGVIRTYLDWIMELPWGEAGQDNFDLNEAETILDQNHYGLPRVKERILEYMAVRARVGEAGNLRTPILCFVGPPGTGKTSLGRSIAEALGRKFARLSLGGIRDEAEIRGHRRTYIGAMPGRIIQTMKRVGTVNPVIMLDEVDKVGLDYRGDPTAALLEVLDPEQNFAFSDHYLDLPYDLSNVLFITTANITYTIAAPLADRMEIIEFPGYIDDEKLAIARQFLIPRHLEEHALSPDDLTFTNQAIQEVMHRYTYESGVRNLDRELGRICRKVVRRLEQGQKAPRSITPKALPRFLGPPKHKNRFLEREAEIGVVSGLSWTPAGGDVLLVEASLYEGKGNLTLTGQLGEVMKESVRAALSYTKANAAKYGIDPACFETVDVHIHVPEGAIPKDGPSAGVAMATALISAFSKRKVRADIAMTGEVTLRGHVLPVGGLRVKVVAAHRVGLKTIIIPQQNQPDFEEIPKKIRQQMRFIAADLMETVLEAALLDPVPPPT
jgi:ATP-dependent Lon protease